MTLRARALCILALVLSFAAPARAETRKLALVGASAELDHSVSVALSPWNLTIVRASWPATAGAHGAAEARALAEEMEVDAVAWVGDSALWLFDVDTNQLVSRPVGGRASSTPALPPVAATTPVDTAMAAATALTLKTLLRSSTVAPRSERVGPAADVLPRPGEVRLGGELGTRLLAPSLPMLDAQIGFLLWPRPFNRHLGFSLMGQGGFLRFTTPSPCAGCAPDWTFSDYALMAAAHTRLPLGEHVAIDPSAGFTFHFTRLDSQQNHEVHADGSVDASLSFILRLSTAVEVGVRGGASYMTSYQHYAYDGQTVLDVLRWEPWGRLVLSIALN
jgi:hypothetical protein